MLKIVIICLGNPFFFFSLWCTFDQLCVHCCIVVKGSNAIKQLNSIPETSPRALIALWPHFFGFIHFVSLSQHDVHWGCSPFHVSLLLFSFSSTNMYAFATHKNTHSFWELQRETMHGPLEGNVDLERKREHFLWWCNLWAFKDSNEKCDVR